MKIISLQAENVKRLTAVTINPEGNLVQITGRNGQGKTSVLDAIWWALEGAANIQAEPIRKGAEEARIRLDLGEYVVTRTFTRKDGGGFTTSIAVESADGASTLNDLPAFLTGTSEDLDAMNLALGKAAIRGMSWRQVQILAHHLHVDIAQAFRVDDSYLAIQSLDQLKELGRLAGIEGANTKTGKALKAAILGSEEAIAKLGVPADVGRLYLEVPEPDPDDEDQDLDEEMRCIGCGCTDSNACDGGCSWLREDDIRMVGVCSSCPEEMDRFDGGDRTVKGEPDAEDLNEHQDTLGEAGEAEDDEEEQAA